MLAIVDTLQEGKIAFIDGNYQKAIKLFSILHENDSNNELLIDCLALSYEQMGLCYSKSRKYTDAANCFRKAIEFQRRSNPESILLLCNSLVWCRAYREVIVKLEQLLQNGFDDNRVFELLSTAYLNINQPNKALNYALEGLKREPTSKFGFNNLGAAFRNLARPDDAKIAFETARDIDPHFYIAHVNLASLQTTQGDHNAALQTYQAALSLLEDESPHRDVIRAHMSFTQLRLGQLEEAWQNYEYRFSDLMISDERRTVCPKFSVPIWNGERSANKKLLIWAEQGISDEVLFMSCLNDINFPHSSIIIECKKRLIDIFQRTFPECEVRQIKAAVVRQDPIGEYDYHLPMGSLMKYTRKRISDFYSSRPYLKPDLNKIEKFKSRLNDLDPVRPKIGISWRSEIKNPLRALESSDIDGWSSILTNKDAIFVNLQYGDCEAELKQAEDKLGVTIYRWSDLDLKNDLDDVFALMAALDLVVTTGTAVYSMSAAVGVETIALMKNDSWTEFNLSYSPWYKNVRIFKNIETMVPDEWPELRNAVNYSINELKANNNILI